MCIFYAHYVLSEVVRDSIASGSRWYQVGKFQQITRLSPMPIKGDIIAPACARKRIGTRISDRIAESGITKAIGSLNLAWQKRSYRFMHRFACLSIASRASESDHIAYSIIQKRCNRWVYDANRYDRFIALQTMISCIASRASASLRVPQKSFSVPQEAIIYRLFRISDAM